LSVEGAPQRAYGVSATLREEHYSQLVESTDDAIISKDRDGIITSWNPAAERMYGYSSEEAVGLPISILIPEHRAGEERRILDRVLAGERLDHYETERVRKDGRLIIVSLTVSGVRDESGEIVRAAVIARDITAFHRSRQLAADLQEVTSALSKEITPERTVKVLLEHAVEALGAAAGAVGVVDRSGSQIELVGHVGHSPERMADWQRFALDSQVPMSAAIREGEPIWSAHSGDLHTRFPGIAEGSARFPSLAVVPFAAGGTPFGAISLSFATPRRFDPEERAFLVAVAQQAAQAMERARLYDAQRIASERLSFLADASELLARSLDPGDALRELADLAVRRLADWCGIELVDEDGGGLRNVAVAHIDPAKIRLADEFRARYPTDPDAETGVPNVIRTGISELYPEVTTEMLTAAAIDDEHLRMMRELGLESVMIVPLTARGRTLGAVTFVSSRPDRHFDGADLQLAEELARRAALAIDNALLFQREHDAAMALQRALLPQSLPEIEGATFAARYDPAGPGLEVGGDWYEVVALEGGGAGLTIGDVAGRGIHGASVMGRVRTALRAYVLDGYGPADAVQRLDRLIKDSDPPEMVTLLQLHVDPATGLAEYVRAGHLPALVRAPGGEVSELDGGGTPPLGVLDPIEYHAHSAKLEPGSLVLLYTDGLVERRNESLTGTLDRLKNLFARAPDEPEECLDWLRREFGVDEAPPDDVAMLAMKID
jgi:PAS domain S-box-containing protein